MRILNLLRFAAVGALALATSCGPSPPEDAGQRQQKPAPWTRPIPENDSDSFTFAIVSDRTGGARPGVFADAVRKLNLLRPDFVVSVGDLIEGYTDDGAEIVRQWKEFDEIAGRLDMPFFYVPGNHDVSSVPMLMEWMERHGRLYYHFVHRNVLFLCLSTEDPGAGDLSARQIEYVSETLAECKDVRWTFVFLHQPLWLYERDTEWEQIEKLLRGRRCTVFAGHLHKYLKCERNGNSYIVLGTTGGVSELKGTAYGTFDHIVWVTMTDAGPRIANLMLDGIWDEDVRTEATAKLVDGIVSGGSIAPGAFFTDGPLLDGLATELKLANDAEAPMTLRAVFQPNPKVRVAPREFALVVPANGVKTINLKLEAGEPVDVREVPPVMMDWSVSWALPNRRLEADGTRRFVIDAILECPRRDGPVLVDGRLDEWRDLPHHCREPAQILFTTAAWSGPGDSSFRFAVEYDDAYLYIAAETIDDRLVVEQGSGPWFQDGIEVRVDARPDPERSAGRGEGKFEKFLLIGLSPGDRLEEMTFAHKEKQPEGVKAACVKTPSGYNTEIAIPARWLDEEQGKVWEAFRLNAAVSDFDGGLGDGTQAAQIWWRPDWERNLNYEGSGTFRRR